jgi:hypothetical protein
MVAKQRLQLMIVAEEFTMLVALYQAQVMRQQIEDEARGDKEVVAKAPDKFKNASNWKLFAEALETYLNQLLGSGWVPLHYVIGRQAHFDPEAQFANEEEQAIALAPLMGPAFQRDNTKVYSIIKQLVLQGPGRSYIMPFDNAADGRRAWLALINHFEGGGFGNRNVEDAYHTLEHLFYKGERKSFNFEKFVERHMECYLELAQHEEPVNESKKVQDFLARIKAPELQAAVQQVRAMAKLSANFTSMANFITLSVIPVKQNAWNIGAINTSANWGGRNGRGGQGRSGQDTTNRGCGRGLRGRGRGNRGRDRSPSGWGKTFTGYFSPQDWQSLTTEQRTQVLEARGTKR